MPRLLDFFATLQLLFLGYALMLHSAPTALALLVTCGLYYSRRTALEAGVLREAFGENYEQWASRTRRFIPWVL
jgi:protein-S-isoprenylcysteine O-methyltransferase Ste14